MAQSASDLELTPKKNLYTCNRAICLNRKIYPSMSPSRFESAIQLFKQLDCFSVRLKKSLCNHAQSCTADCRLSHLLNNGKVGRAVAQGVSRRLLTAAAQVRVRVRLCGIGGEQRGAGACFLRILRFPLPRIPAVAPHSSPSIISEGWYNRPVVVSAIVDSVPLRRKRKKRGKIIRDMHVVHTCVKFE
jgi:hypothetical protein